MLFFEKKILTSEQLRHMFYHRYNVQGNTVLDPIMQIYWCWLAKRLPIWLNSNVITVVGLALNMISCAVLVSYSPSAVHEAPRWCYSFAAVTMFLYQTCDALDGKQCVRHLKAKDWHLAEVFDHGCDSISTVCVVIQLAICMQIGDRPVLTLLLMFASVFMFFTAHWQTYISGVVRFGTIDVTESELSLAFAYLLTAIFGTKVWAMKVLGSELREILVVAIVITGIIKFVNHAIFISKRGYRVTVADTNIISPMWHIATLLVLSLATKTTTNLYEVQPCFFLMIFGLIGAKMSNKVMIAYMTKSKLILVDTIFIGPLLLLIYALTMKSPVSEVVLLAAVVIYSATNLFHYLAVVSLQIRDLLKITCFVPYDSEKIHPEE